MKIEMPHGSAKMLPASSAVPQDRGNENNKDQSDADANQKQSRLAIFAKKL
jgi:hypothetical protein